MNDDLALACRLADLADAVTLARWSPSGVASRTKDDGSPVTEADLRAEQVIFDEVSRVHPADAHLGEETGSRPGTTGRRWIVDGIDGTRFFVAGERTWGTLIALECDGRIVLGVASSPAQDRRWWASAGNGAFCGATSAEGEVTRLRIERSASTGGSSLLVVLPRFELLSEDRRDAVEQLAGGLPVERPWSHQIRVAEGEVAAAIWFAGEVWDHAAPSIIVEEAGGRFTDHRGGIDSTLAPRCIRTANITTRSSMSSPGWGRHRGDGVDRRRDALRHLAGSAPCVQGRAS